MKSKAMIVCLLLVASGGAQAQEMSAEEIIRRIQETVGSEAEPGQTAKSGGDRALFIENGVDAERLPADFDPPEGPASKLSGQIEPLASPPGSALGDRCRTAAEFRQILFDRGSAKLSNDDGTRATVAELAKALSSPRLTKLSFVVRGHTDATGPVRVNGPLSKARAETVARQLAYYGVPLSRLTARGMASRVPADPADPYSFKNRRVEICV
jgi:outer membrane protein OmpA-like peptidoglycan-associated protein